MNATTTRPRVKAVKVKAGIAGQVAYMATVDHGYGPSTYVFYGSVYGSPGVVHVVWCNGNQERIDCPQRFGDRFDAEWIHRFFDDV